jgi:hypothetical protein
MIPRKRLARNPAAAIKRLGFAWERMFLAGRGERNSSSGREHNSSHAVLRSCTCADKSGSKRRVGAGTRISGARRICLQ